VTQAAVPPRALLLVYFVGVILAGTLLLLLPSAWQGQGRLSPINALFTATSAVCVTGLTVVDIADYTRLGQAVVLSLIQAGGLGIIAFSTFFLMLPGRRRMSFRARHFIQAYSLPVVENNPARVTLYILSFTLGIELAGSLILYPYFRGRVEDPVFTSVFHAVSAFCNAGFSTFRTNFEAHRTSAHLLLTSSALIVTGGLGFVVCVDVAKRVAGLKRKLTFHSRIVILATVMLIVCGAALFYVFESSGAMAGLDAGARVLNSLFQSITPRTAGFNTLPQSGLRLPSQALTMLLMFIGGSSGSTAGGIKTSTASLVLLQVFSARDPKGEIAIFDRKLSSPLLSDALLFALRAMGLLFAGVFLLLLFESGTGKSFVSLAFESFSAFGTVGLSLGITPDLTSWGKLVIIATMFCGRVGIISLAGRDTRTRVERVIDFPQAEVLIG